MAALLSGCATPSTTINKIHIGMTEAEVIKVMGEPVGRGESKDGTKMLYYSLQEYVGQPPLPYAIEMQNGKVESYGRDAGISAGSPAAIPMPIVTPVVR